jgi:hypothetical protein
MYCLQKEKIYYHLTSYRRPWVPHGILLISIPLAKGFESDDRVGDRNELFLLMIGCTH